MIPPSQLVAHAADLARTAHAGQLDKAGFPYAAHPERVARSVAGDALAEAVAWLHDVVEDTQTTLDDLREAGFPERVVAAVDALTRRPSELPDAYYARVARDPLATRVKRADLDDNSDPIRLRELDQPTRTRLQEKYAHAREVLDRWESAPGD